MAVKRLMAVVAAVSMVVGALVLRGFLDDGGDLSLGGGSSTIYCDDAIAEACRSVFDAADLVVEAPGRTLDRFLDDTDDGAAVWIASDLWFDILEAEEARLGPGTDITDTSEPIAHSPLVLATKEAACVDDITWQCVSRIDGRLGTGGNLDSSVGLATQIQLVVTALGRPTFASNDPDFRAWESEVAVEVEASRSESALLGTYLNSPGVVDAIALSDAAVVALDRATGAVVPPDAGPDLEVAAIALGGARMPGALDDLGEELEGDGWQTGAAPEAERPSGGAMQALRS